MTETETAVHDAARLRDDLTNALIASGWITSPAVEAAFRRVPRHAFAPPGTTLGDAYADDVIRTRFDPGGTCLSSVSAPWLQAAMIGQAGIGPGMRVLEVGSGGYNAALLAEVAGLEGHVITIDIDPGVTEATAAALDAAGYGQRVTVITGDAEHGVSQHAPFDAIIVTAGAWDIAPAWITQLAPGSGTLVVPLRMNGWTRSIAFRSLGDHLASTSAQVCGFVPLQGSGARVEQATAFDAPGDGGHVLIRSEDPAFGDPPLPWDLLAGDPVTAWSGITTENMTSFADLYLWLGGFAGGSCKITAEDGTRLPGDQGRPGRYPAAIIDAGSLACLITRKLGEASAEFGACAYGPRAGQAATALLRHISDWDRHSRDLPGTAFAAGPPVLRPPGTDRARPRCSPSSTAPQPSPGRPAPRRARTRRPRREMKPTTGHAERVRGRAAPAPLITGGRMDNPAR